jgi:E3 ubiquitin-protein ligase MARCH6
MSADIFTGQIIASLIVLSFVAVFLLREWISQNARPGVFEDEEGEDRAAQRPLPAQPAPEPAPQLPPPLDMPEPLPRVEGNHVDLPLIVNVGRGRGRKIRRHVAGNRRVDRHIVNQKKGKGRIEETLEDRDSNLPAASRTRRRLESDDDAEVDSALPSLDVGTRKGVSARRIQAARLAAAAERRQKEERESKDSWHEGSDAKKFEFTFKAPEAALRESQFETRASVFFSNNFPSEPAPSFDNVLDRATTPPNRSWSTSQASSVEPSPAPSFGLFGTESAVDTASSPSTPTTPSSLSIPMPRRPPLPTMTLPAADGPTTPPIASLSRSVTHTPLASPSLATYRAPEELEAGPSRLASEYFNQADSSPDTVDWDEADLSQGSMEDEHALYFQEPDVDEEHENEGQAGALAELLAFDSGDDTEEAFDDDEDAEEDSAGPYVEADDEDEEEQENEEIFDFVEVEEADWDIGGEVQRPADVVDVNLGQPQPQPQLQQGPAVAEGVQMLDPDDLEGNVEDDMEGAMEGTSDILLKRIH